MLFHFKEIAADFNLSAHVAPGAARNRKRILERSLKPVGCFALSADLQLHRFLLLCRDQKFFHMLIGDRILRHAAVQRHAARVVPL